MEVDEIQRQVCKFQRICSNGSTTSDNSTNPNKIGTPKANHRYLGEDGGGGDDGGGGGGGGVRICGWPSSRIVRVSRASGGKDRHSKVLTSKGLRDRRVRLSVTTAIQFYDLQDRLGYDQPSKAVEWLIKAAATSIAELPSLDPLFSGGVDEHYHQHHRKTKKLNSVNDTEYEDPNRQTHQQNNNNNISVSKSSVCSSTSETSKGSGLSLSRSENRIKARERAREMAAKKEKEKESDPTRVANGISQTSSFTDLLTGGISGATASPESRIHWTIPMDYFFGRPPHEENQPHHHYSFLQENFTPVVTTTTAAGDGGGGGPGFNRGTLQSNLLSVLPHHQLQRFQSSTMVDGSTSTNFPFFIGSTTPENFPVTAGYDSQRRQLYGGADGGRAAHSDHRKEKSKN